MPSQRKNSAATRGAASGLRLPGSGSTLAPSGPSPASVMDGPPIMSPIGSPMHMGGHSLDSAPRPPFAPQSHGAPMPNSTYGMPATSQPGMGPRFAQMQTGPMQHRHNYPHSHNQQFSHSMMTGNPTQNSFGPNMHPNQYRPSLPGQTMTPNVVVSNQQNCAGSFSGPNGLMPSTGYQGPMGPQGMMGTNSPMPSHDGQMITPMDPSGMSGMMGPHHPMGGPVNPGSMYGPNSTPVPNSVGMPNGSVAVPGMSNPMMGPNSVVNHPQMMANGAKFSSGTPADFTFRDNPMGGPNVTIGTSNGQFVGPPSASLPNSMGPVFNFGAPNGGSNGGPNAKVYPPDQPMVFNPANPHAPPIYPCGICHREVHDTDEAILCESGCNFWFHRVCTGLNPQAYTLLTSEVYAEWVCDRCLNTKQIPLVKLKA